MMNLKQLSLLAIGTVFFVGTAAAQTPNPNNKEEMRQLVMTMCPAEQAQSCTCLADNMAKDLTTKEWTIFIAAMQDAPEPPAGTTEEELVQFATKLQTALQSCQPAGN